MSDALGRDAAAESKARQSDSVRRVKKHLPLNADVPSRYRIRHLGVVVQAGTKIECEVDIEPRQA